MKDEYIIINKKALEKMIGELAKERDGYAFNPTRTDDYYRYNSMIKVIKEILSQSIPLISEIEKAFDVGWLHNQLPLSSMTKQDYIKNLKLEI